MASLSSPVPHLSKGGEKPLPQHTYPPLPSPILLDLLSFSFSLFSPSGWLLVEHSIFLGEEILILSSLVIFYSSGYLVIYYSPSPSPPRWAPATHSPLGCHP
ncbi:hypothetical protein BJX61DRAFT_298505 [Aspergillus egyptiacus]|nr:hypothetical protein BJX61DRAFT_298505 [Aspergillus egyptiacus]